MSKVIEIIENHIPEVGTFIIGDLSDRQRNISVARAEAHATRTNSDEI